MCLSDLDTGVEEIMDVFHSQVELGKGRFLFILTRDELLDPKNILFSCISKQILNYIISIFFFFCHFGIIFWT